MSNISDFLGALKNGGARPNRFEVLVSFPAFAASNTQISQTPYLVTASIIPGSTLGTIDQTFRGRIIKFAGDRTYDDWTATFLNDTDFGLHDAFEKWHNGINAYNSNIGFQVPSDYVSTVSIYQLDNQDNRVKEVTIKYAFPYIVGAITLDQSQSNVIETFDVTFAYSDIENGNNT